MPEQASCPCYIRHAGMLAGPPPPIPTVYESRCPTPSREQVPVCPVPTCFSSLLPMASLPCFLLVALPEGCGLLCCAAAGGIAHTDHPGILALCRARTVA